MSALFASLTLIVCHLGCGLSCEPPWYVHTGDVYELQVAPEGSQRARRETTEELLRGWHHLILTCRRLSHHRSRGRVLKCVCVCMWYWCHCLAPLLLSTHLRERRKFLLLFLSTSMPLPWLSPEQTALPMLNQGQDFKARKNPSLTTCRVIQEAEVSLWMLWQSFMSSLVRWGPLLGM